MALICFDLDGTLVDPLEGVVESLAQACTELDAPCPARDRIADRIGLDLGELFPELPQSRVQDLLARYERIFEDEGTSQQRILDGVQSLLARLKRQGHHLLLAACQPEAAARRTLHQFDLLLVFDGVVGKRPGEPWRNKQDLLERLRLEGLFQAGGWAIGDRGADILAARALGLRSVGATYGFGSHQELLTAQADLLVQSVQDLDAWLEKEFKEPEIHDPFSRSE